VIDNVRELIITRVEPPSGDPFLDSVEIAILRCLTECIEHERDLMLHQAIGLAWARALYLRAQGRPETEIRHHGKFIADATIVIRKLSSRQRAKLLHPTSTRADAQRLLDGEES
jgi:hypothetical protein